MKEHDHAITLLICWHFPGWLLPTDACFFLHQPIIKWQCLDNWRIWLGAFLELLHGELSVIILKTRCIFNQCLQVHFTSCTITHAPLNTTICKLALTVNFLTCCFTFQTLGLVRQNYQVWLAILLVEPVIFAPECLASLFFVSTCLAKPGVWKVKQQVKYC